MKLCCIILMLVTLTKLMQFLFQREKGRLLVNTSYLILCSLVFMTKIIMYLLPFFDEKIIVLHNF